MKPAFRCLVLAMQNELALHSKKEIDEYFAHVWQTMQACIDRGMNTEGVLPGPLRVPRRASALRRMLVSSDKLSNDPMNVIDWVNMFALAVNEENAAGGRVVLRQLTVPAVSFRQCWLTMTTLLNQLAQTSIPVTLWQRARLVHCIK